MLDINYIRENKDLVKKASADKGVEVDIERLLEVDKQRRGLIQKVDELRQQRNQAAKSQDIEKGRKVKEELDNLEKELREAEDRFKHEMEYIPNLPLEDVPSGGEDDFREIKKEGEPTKLDFTPKDHVEIGELLDIIDIPRATKVSGSRFAYLKNEGVLLEFALVQYALENLVKEGFIPVIPPVLIKKELTEGLGYWAAGNNNNYYLVTDFEENNLGGESPNPLYLIGTGEHAVVPMHSGELFEEEGLPLKYAAFSSCFRREAGTYGKDTRGILRVHQFDKVEMVAFVKPEDDENLRKKILELAESLVKGLGLPYRVVKLARGDLSFPSAETVDIETWIPSQNKYRETHSISTTTDFQARRLNIKYKKKDGLIEYVHILNGTAIAIGRILIAILENYQQKDGSVKIPQALQKYTGFSTITPKV